MVFCRNSSCATWAVERPRPAITLLFALAHTSKKCQVDCFLLGGWKPTDYLADQAARVTKHDFFFGGIMDPCIRLLFGFILQPFFCTRISLLFPQPVNRPTPGQCHHPAKWFALL